MIYDFGTNAGVKRFDGRWASRVFIIVLASANPFRVTNFEGPFSAAHLPPSAVLYPG